MCDRPTPASSALQRASQMVEEVLKLGREGKCAVFPHRPLMRWVAGFLGGRHSGAPSCRSRSPERTGSDISFGDPEGWGSKLTLLLQLCSSLFPAFICTVAGCHTDTRVGDLGCSAGSHLSHTIKLFMWCVRTGTRWREWDMHTVIAAWLTTAGSGCPPDLHQSRWTEYSLPIRWRLLWQWQGRTYWPMLQYGWIVERISERSRTQVYVWKIWNVQSSKSTEKEMSAYQCLGRRKNGEWLLMGIRFPLGGDKMF